MRARLFPARLPSFSSLIVLLTFAPALLGGCAPVDILNGTIPTSGLTITRDVAYGADARQKLDIYVPKNAPPHLPVIVFFYGGAWQMGDKADYLFAAEALASRGMIVVVPNYRLYPEVTFPGFAEDGAAATAWAIRNVVKIGGDPHRIFIAGHSAGAYIAIMLAMNGDYLARADVSTNDLAGAIGISGPYNFLPLTRTDVKPIFEVVADMSRTQPISFARPDAPPLLLLDGAADRTVDPENTLTMATAQQAAGGKVELHLYPGIGHIGAITALTPLFRSRAPVLDDIDRFVHAVH